MEGAVAIVSSVVLILLFVSLALGFFFLELPRARRVFAVATLSLIGLWVEVSAISGAFQGRAMEITPHDQWFPRSDFPVRFWLSVVFHLLLGLAVLWTARHVWRLPDKPPEIARGEARASFVRVMRWPILALALAAVWRWIAMVS
jgi:hypothetical protein